MGCCYGFVLLFIIIIFSKCLYAALFLVGNFWDVNGTGTMKQANAGTYNGN